LVDAMPLTNCLVLIRFTFCILKQILVLNEVTQLIFWLKLFDLDNSDLFIGVILEAVVSELVERTSLSNPNSLNYELLELQTSNSSNRAEPYWLKGELVGKDEGKHAPQG